MASSSNAGAFGYVATAGGTPANVAGVTSMSVNLNIATIDLTTMGSNRFRTYGGGKYQGTFTVEFLLDHEVHNALVNAYKNATIGRASLAFGGTAGTIAGDCIITGVDYGAQMDGAATLSITGRFTGTIGY